MTKLLWILALIVSFGSTAYCESIKIDFHKSLDLAMKNSPVMEAAAGDIGIANANLSKAKAAQSPTLSLDSSYQYLSKPTLFFDQPIYKKETWTVSPTLTQPIYTGGRIEASISAAKNNMRAAELQGQFAKSSTMLDVAAAYFEARKAREGVSVAEKSTISLNAALQSATKMKEAGIVAKADVLRAEADLAAAQEQLVRAKNGYTVALVALKGVIGDPSLDLELVDQAEPPLISGANEPTAQKVPQVAAMESQLKASEYGIKAARAGSMPQLSLMADFEHINQGARFPRDQDTFFAGVKFSIPIFNGGLTRSETNEAKFARDKAAASLRAAEIAADTELAQARAELENSNVRLSAAQSGVTAAEESLRLLEKGYTEGISTMTDILAAQAALSGARYREIEARNDLRFSEARLLVSLGQTQNLFVKE